MSELENIDDYTDSLFSENELNEIDRKNQVTYKDWETAYKLPSLRTMNQKYVIQPNNITKAIYDMNLGSKRIVMMACSLLLERDENGMLTTKDDLTVKFQLEDVMKSLQLSHGSTTKKMLDQAVDTIFDQKIRIKTEEGWTQLYHWFVSSNYSLEKNGIELTFTPEVAKAFVEYLNGYSVINLDVYGSLNGKYSIRMYELCWSYHGFASKKTGEWKTPPIPISEIRAMWQIDDSKYPVMSDFKKRVFEVARNEINSYRNSQFTVEKIEDIKQGKKIVACVFCCQLRDVKKDPIKSLIATRETSDEEIMQEHSDEILEAYKQELRSRKEELENSQNRMTAENNLYEEIKQQIIEKYKK